MRLRLEKRLTLIDAVEARLQRWIVRGELSPGGLLPPEGRLAHEFGVSRGTLRHAISRLVCRGLLETSQGRQTRVSALGRFVGFDALLPTLLAHSSAAAAEELLDSLLEMRRHLYAIVLALACRRSDDVQPLRTACTEVAFHARWEGNTLNVVCLEHHLLGIAAQCAGNLVFFHALSSLHQLLEQLPIAWFQGRPVQAIERRMSRTDELLAARRSQELENFTLEALAIEDTASMAALRAAKERSWVCRDSWIEAG